MIAAFRMAIVAKRNTREINVDGRSFAPIDENSIVNVIQSICGTLADRDIADFRVDGFGQSPWPVDVRTDLATVLEQIPMLLKRVRLAQKCTLDFYEQGLERTLELMPDGSNCIISCASRTAWIPAPRCHVVSLLELENMLVALLVDFIGLAYAVMPNLTRNTLFVDWAGVAKTQG